jgi:LmbE family N-acetylglucosaminyl deacetylase
MMFYGYATGVFSSRKLEQASHDSVAFRFITADGHPDHDTIATFRKRFLAELDIPDELARREDRLAAIARAKKEIQRRAQARYEAEKAEYEEKLKRPSGERGQDW